jgi:prepilin-type N-terminal cleavage/methylation domain-containing protein
MKMKYQKRRGLTLTELMVTILIVAIIVGAIGVMFVDTHRGWLDSYAKIHGGAAADAAMSQVAFDKIIRKSSRSKYQMKGLDELTVYYYADWQTSAELDRYARFYRSADDAMEFCVEHGQWDGTNQSQLSKVTLATNVMDLEFKPTSGGIEMKMALNDGRETTTLVTTAILHNE